MASFSDPVDLQGYITTTVQDLSAQPGYADFHYNGFGIAVSPDKAYVYAVRASDGGIMRIATATGVIETNWVPGTSCGRSNEFVVTGPDGTLYTFDGTTTIGRVTPDGTVLNNVVSSPWTTAPAGYIDAASPFGEGFGACFGRDGNIYVTTETASPDFFPTILKVTPDGTWTELTAFNLGSVDFQYENVAATADGHVGASIHWFRNFDSASLLAIYEPTGHTMTIQPVQYLIDNEDEPTDITGVFADDSGGFIVAMRNDQIEYIVNNILSDDDSHFTTGVGNWIPLTDNTSISVVTSPAHGTSKTLRFEATNVDGDSTFIGLNGSQSLPYPVPGLYPVTAGVSYMVSAWGGQDPGNQSISGDFPEDYSFSVEARFYGSDGAERPPFPGGDSSFAVPFHLNEGNVIYDPAKPYAPLRQKHGSVVVAPAGAEWVTITIGFDNSGQEVGTTMYLSDVTFGASQNPHPTLPRLGWFLKVAIDGTAERIAGTWDYLGHPGPAATATNIADGALGTSLARAPYEGATISPDGTSLWFIDDLTDFGWELLRKIEKPRLTLTPRNTRLWRVGQP